LKAWTERTPVKRFAQMNDQTIHYWIEKLQLTRHPEGGYYRETYRSHLMYEGRNLSTSIYYLLPGDKHSRFHRLRYDEIWYFHAGDPLKLYFLHPGGILGEHVLGNDPEEGQQLALRVPAKTIFGGEVGGAGNHSLVSCHMSPGFHFEDFEMFTPEELTGMFPEHQSIIKKLS
jgi:hypothetical protein